MPVARHLQNVSVPLIVANRLLALGVGAHEMDAIARSFADGLRLLVDQIFGSQAPRSRARLFVAALPILDLANRSKRLLDHVAEV